MILEFIVYLTYGVVLGLFGFLLAISYGRLRTAHTFFERLKVFIPHAIYSVAFLTLTMLVMQKYVTNLLEAILVAVPAILGWFFAWRPLYKREKKARLV